MTKKIKVLMVAPISKDKGGSYTTGVCKVAESLMDQKYEDTTLYLSSTNVSDKKAKLLCKYPNQYNGYKFYFKDIIKTFILHPLKVVKEFRFYKDKCHVNPLRYFFYRINLERHIKNIKPDIIHVHTTESPAVQIANKQHTPTVVTMHGFFYRGESDRDKLDFLYNSTKTFNSFTGLTRECQSLMSRYLNLNEKQIEIIPNGIETSRFIFDKVERNRLRTKMGVTDSLVFITVASLQPRKGQLSFIKILQHLNISWKYWIIGTGPDERNIIDYCKKNGLNDKVVLIGNVASHQLYKYYSAADVYAHTSTMEGQSLSEMEAYATGLRIIVNRSLVDTINTDVNDRETYYKIDMENVDYLDLKSWLTYKPRPSITRQSIEWQEIANRYNELYKKVLKN